MATGGAGKTVEGIPLSDPDSDGVNKIRHIFVEKIDPISILYFFHKYDINVLTQANLEKVKAITSANGKTVGATELLDLLLGYKNWWSCLLKVLRDPSIRQRHVADLLQQTLELSSQKYKEPQEPASRKQAANILTGRNKTMLLIGKTGEGKSSTGNNILGSEIFTSEASARAVTNTVDHAVGCHEGRSVWLVDTPGLFSTEPGSNTEELVQRAVETLAGAIALCPEGYDAFLYVIRCGNRFTQEDRLTLTLLKTIFGRDVVQKYCILVMTHADIYENQHGGSALNWATTQDGPLQDLLCEVGGRVVCVSNNSRDPETRMAQVNEIMHQVDSLLQPPYTVENLSENEAFREEICERGKQLAFCQNALEEIKLIIKKYRGAKKYKQPSDQLEPLRLALCQASELRDRMDLRNTIHYPEKFGHRAPRQELPPMKQEMPKYYLCTKRLIVDVHTALESRISKLEDFERKRDLHDARGKRGPAKAEMKTLEKALSDWMIEQKKEWRDIEADLAAAKVEIASDIWEVWREYIYRLFTVMKELIDSDFPMRYRREVKDLFRTSLETHKSSK